MPIIVASAIEWKKRVEKIEGWVVKWAPLVFWLEDTNPQKKLDGSPYTKFKLNDDHTEKYASKINRAILFAYPLVKISDEKAIENLIAKPLIQMK